MILLEMQDQQQVRREGNKNQLQFLKNTAHLFIKYNYTSRMSVQPCKLNSLFTFGHGQLQQCLSLEKKPRFPFLQNAKMKKTPLLHKLVSEQRQKICPTNQNANNINLPLPLNTRDRISSQGCKRVTFSLNKQVNKAETNRENSSSKKNIKKSSLPKVLPDVFLNTKRQAIAKRKITSAEPSLRYLAQENSLQLVQPFNLIENQCQSVFKDMRPKSVMFISQNFCEIPQQKIKTIQHHRSRLYSKAYMSKPDPKMRVAGLNTKIMENINEYKKIYC